MTKQNGHREAVEYLEENGCVLSNDYMNENSGSELIDFFEVEFGPVDGRSFFEIIPTSPVDIHIIPPESERNTVVLFTAGLSETAIEAPVPELNDRRVELYVELPGDWKYSATADPHWNWPARWLQRISCTLAQGDVWLDDFTIYATETLKPIAAHLAFTSFLLMNDKQFVDSSGLQIDLFRLVPLHTAERQLEIEKGLPALLTSLDNANVSLTVMPDRKSIV